ncbi:MAG: hypothetical protein WB679_01665 [Terracidiphilus sp.]
MNRRPDSVLLSGVKMVPASKSRFSTRIRYNSRALRMPVSRITTMMSLSGCSATGKSLLSASSLSRSERPGSLNKEKSGISRIRFSSLALVNIRRKVLSALLPVEGEPGNFSFSMSSFLIWSIRLPMIFVFARSRHPFL